MTEIERPLHDVDMSVLDARGRSDRADGRRARGSQRRIGLAGPDGGAPVPPSPRRDGLALRLRVHRPDGHLRPDHGALLRDRTPPTGRDGRPGHGCGHDAIELQPAVLGGMVRHRRPRPRPLLPHHLGRPCLAVHRPRRRVLGQRHRHDHRCLGRLPGRPDRRPADANHRPVPRVPAPRDAAGATQPVRRDRRARVGCSASSTRSDSSSCCSRSSAGWVSPASSAASCSA